MKQGRIIKVISNHYTILCDDETVVAKPRGTMRKGQKPFAGDLVNFEQIEDSYRIDSILPRINQLLRPSVCNIDQALVVTSLKDPDFNVHLLDRLLFSVLLCNIEPVICITKSDLVSPEEFATFKALLDRYEQSGYRVFYSHPGSDDEDLKALLSHKISVLCGQTGAGKSSLLNRLEPSFQLRTQETSKALGRGKHTTRHCELFPIAEGLVADTPGFSSLDFSHLDIAKLAKVIPDFQEALEQGCKFADCIHVHEPGCAVKKAVEEGRINPTIYDDYVQVINSPRKYR
ncbi:MAG: ribosome small subunit-dependent GTPase A [Allobaculum sp.]|nr:ribosome small subunit-dependent GTPase A [Allobaculum sp.]